MRAKHAMVASQRTRRFARLAQILRCAEALAQDDNQNCKATLRKQLADRSLFVIGLNRPANHEETSVSKLFT